MYIWSLITPTLVFRIVIFCQFHIFRGTMSQFYCETSVYQRSVVTTIQRSNVSYCMYMYCKNQPYDPLRHCSNIVAFRPSAGDAIPCAQFGFMLVFFCVSSM